MTHLSSKGMKFESHPSFKVKVYIYIWSAAYLLMSHYFKLLYLKSSKCSISKKCDLTLKQTLPQLSETLISKYLLLP